MLAIGNVCASIHFFSFFPRMHRTKQVFICDFHNMNLCVIHSTSNKSSTCSLHLLAHCFSSHILFHSTSSFCCCGCGCWLVKIVRQINRLRLISDMSRCEFFFVLRKFKQQHSTRNIFNFIRYSQRFLNMKTSANRLHFSPLSGKFIRSLLGLFRSWSE